MTTTIVADAIANAGTGTVIPTLPASQFVANSTSGATTAAAGDLTGAAICCLNLSAVGAANYTTRTAAQMFADLPNAQVGQTWLIIINNSSGGTTTLVGGTGVTVTGTATMATGTTRIFTARITGVAAITLQNMGGGIAT